MTSIYSGNLMRNFVKDNNQRRLENYDPNRFNRTLDQSAAQARRENELKEGLEYQQARLADLQTKANEVTEKLNNLYRRYIDNKVAFRKVSAEPRYFGTSEALNNLPDVTDDSGLPKDYPTGAPNNLLPFDDPGRIRNYSYNPYFGSKAIDESDQNVIRTYFQEEGQSAENAYRENGAFWSAISYLWGWDLDRINATYVTTTNGDDKQVNVTALQPNKNQSPPLQVGDRFPVKWTEDPTDPGSENFPAVNIMGLRPGGVDFSHATDSLNTGGDGASSTANMNVIGENSVNWGWEFDDLPLALEVTEVSQQPDGNAIATGYRMVYDIPPTHPFYEDLKVLNGTEPQITDAPTELRKERLNNEGFRYTGTAFFPGSNVVGFQVGPLFRSSRGAWVISQPGEGEYSAPGNYTVADGPIASFELETCIPGLTIDGTTHVSFDYRFRVHQNSAAFGSTWDDSGPGVPSRFGFSRHDWNSAGNEAFGGGNAFGVPLPGTFDTLTNQPAETLLLLGESPSDNSFGTDYLKTSGKEQLYARVSAGSDTDRVRVDFYFEGDLNQLEIEVSDFQIVDYTGELNSWTQGKYNPGNVDPVIMEGDPQFTTNPDDVINKYYPNVYQFTQFNDQYTNSFSSFDRNDIVRSPWEFGLLNIDDGSGLSGEMFLNLNGRRLNLDHDAVVDQVEVWDGSTAAPVNTNTAVVQGDAVAKAYEFVPATFAQAVTHPGDDCGPNPTMNILGSNTGTGNPFNPSAPSGGIAVDSTTGFTVGQQVSVNGQLRTILAIVDDAGSPGGITTDPVFDNPATPTYELRPPFDGSLAIEDSGGSPITMPPANYDASALPVPLGDFPITIAGTAYADYAAISAAYPPIAAHPHAADPNNELHWVEYTQSSSPVVPARREIFLNAPVAPAPTSGTITPWIITPEPPRSAQFADSDPLTNFNTRHILLHDEILAGETPLDPAALPAFPPGTPATEAPLDPGRTANPVASDPNNNNFDWADPDFYENFADAFDSPPSTSNNPTDFITGIANDAGDNTNPDYNNIDGTIDRVMGSDMNMQYRISIPTNDVNVLRKENNLLFNVGAIDERDWGVEIVNPYMEFRTAPDYQTVPRYRVDAGGNIYDAFGKGYYEDNASSVNFLDKDLESVNRLYTTEGGAGQNNQVSNFDKSYDMSNYEQYDLNAASFEDFINDKNRLSMNGDDYNLFDYVPDLNEIPGNTEGARHGESYVGSLPSNFYYYREPLDDSQTGSGVPLTGDEYNQDNQGAINFNAKGSNRSGIYNDASTTIVHNPNMPSWANVKIGVSEQKAHLSNQQRTTTWARWDGFAGLGGESQHALRIAAQSNIGNAINALGIPDQNPASLNAGGSSLTLDMGRPVNDAGHLILHELVAGTPIPRAVPLPLKDLAIFPNPPATSYSFSALGAETVTRTGSRYVSNFADQILDGLDGSFDSSWNNATATALLQSAGATVSSTHPPNSWGAGLVLHVDNADAFDLESPRNQVFLGTDPSVTYRVVSKNSLNSPQTLFLIPDIGTIAANLQNKVHTDLQVSQVTGEYTVSVLDSSGALNADGNFLQIAYDDNGTQLPGLLDSVELSSAIDRVGRLAGNDPRTVVDESLLADNPVTAHIENQRIGPEVFEDPNGYVQADARINLNMVSQDKDGNPLVRKLRNIRIVVDSGEQLIPNKIGQTYSTEGPFDLNGEWPIAIYEGDRQLNPFATTDLDIMVGLRQGITDGTQATNVADPRMTMTSTAGFAIGEEVYINGESRLIADIQGNDLVLNRTLSQLPRTGDVASLGNNSQGVRELGLFINKSYALSSGAPIRVELEYEDYQMTGYPPVVDLTTPVGTSTETIGFFDPDPSQSMEILSTNTGTGTAGSPIVVDDHSGFNTNDKINIGGQTYTITGLGITPDSLTLDRPINPAPNGGNITRTDYQNYLVVGNGESGGSFENEFAEELKRIIDNPEYQEMLKYNLMKNVFITASVNDPFNDVIASKLMLNWDRRQREMEIMQVAFNAYYTSI